MFKRKKPLDLFSQLRRLIWPVKGWERNFTYYWKRIVRIPDSPHSIAMGFSIGVFVAFTPFLGFHTILSIFIYSSMVSITRCKLSAINSLFSSLFTGALLQTKDLYNALNFATEGCSIVVRETQKKDSKELSVLPVLNQFSRIKKPRNHK